MNPVRTEGSLALEASGPPSSLPASACPGCGQAVDPLRAGHVAALEGLGFHYFCRAACKDDYLRARGRPLEDDVETATPPEVAYVQALIEAPVAPPRLSAPSRSRPSFPVTPTPPPAAVEASPDTARSVSWSALAPAHGPRQETHARQERGETRASVKLRAPQPLPESGIRPVERSLAVIDGVGMVAGVLAPAIGLLGTVADVARVPLVAVAFGALAVRIERTRRDPADPTPLVVLGPAAGAALAALWARLAGDPRADGIAALAGLGCAVAIALEALVARARVGVQLARARIERALDVTARVIHGEDTVELHASEVRPGEQVVIEANEVIGVDATITAGEARVVPWPDAQIEIVKREGDPVVAGARVLSSRLRVITTWSGRERAWVKLLSVAPARIDVAAPTVRVLRLTVERGVPIAAAIVGLAAFAANATPVEILASMSAGAIAFGSKALASLAAVHFARAHVEALASGITYKDARAFERAGSANIAVLSARGTVLMGEPEIVAIEPIGSTDVLRVLSLAAGAETASAHPFAAAILRAARNRSAYPDHVRNATVHSGLGVTALASSGERLVVGGRSIMLSEKIGVASADARVTELEAQGRSVLLVALGDRLVGLIALQDGLRAGARAAVQRLLDARIEPVLLSGEARDTCETIGRALDIEHVRPAVLPAERGAEVRALAEGGSVVAVVGHAASDDGALGAADVAIAMGAAGSTPGEWAVSLASDDVRDAALALSIPHAARARLRLAIALGAIPAVVSLLAVGFGVAPLAVAPLGALLGGAAVALTILSPSR